VLAETEAFKSTKVATYPAGALALWASWWNSGYASKASTVSGST